uniref:Pleckstrin homology domain containing, family J member 1 n=1 Tax=Zonotrichia albicollis TaxID=44394 RepID=A0A8D2NJH9_ZONAL
MVAVPCECHIPKILQQRHLRAHSQCSFTPWLSLQVSQFLSQGCFPLGFKSWCLCKGPQGVSPGSGHAGPVQVTLSLGSCSSQGLRLLEAGKCCGQLPQAPREWERGWKWGWQIHSQLIFINRAANCGLAEPGEQQQLCQDLPGAFSLSLAGFIEEPERKYCFECATEEQCQEWVEALKRASYEFLRRSLIFYRNEIQKMTGKVSESLQV